MSVAKYAGVQKGLQGILRSRKLAVTDIARAIGKSRENTRALLANPYDLRVRQLIVIAGLLRVDYLELFKLVYRRDDTAPDLVESLADLLPSVEGDE